jgi:hypothetical protein
VIVNETSPTSLLTIGIIGDKLFPTEKYNEVQKLVMAKLGHKSSYDDFSYSWNALGHRFHGAILLSQSLIESLGPPPKAGSMEARHKEDQELFYFFSSSFSSIECLYYSAFAVGEMTTGKFDFNNPKTQRKIKPDFVIQKFKESLPSTTLASQLEACILPDSGTTGTYSELVQIRNVLSHRSQPGRTFGWSGPSDPTTMWHKFELTLSDKLIAKHRDFLGKVTTAIISDLYVYLQDFS